jgi:chitinase
MVPFANQLRSVMTASSATTGKQYFLTAAPQCPYPDAADGSMLAGAVSFDAIWVQFYNNYCGLGSFTVGSSTQNNFNFATWDNWAKTVSLNPNVKIILGIPGSPTAAGSGYESGSTLADIISYSKSFSSFGGVMIWDMSQVYSNSGFLAQVSSDLGLPASGGGGGTTTTTSSVGTTLTTVTKTTTTSKTTSTTTASNLPTAPAGACGSTYDVSCGAGYCCSQVRISPSPSPNILRDLKLLT